MNFSKRFDNLPVKVVQRVEDGIIHRERTKRLLLFLGQRPDPLRHGCSVLHGRTVRLQYRCIQPDRGIGERWAIGLHTDIVVEKYKVEKNFGNKEVIERSYPIAPALMGLYKAGKHWSFSLGIGGDFSKEESFFLTRAGVEYGAEIRSGWEVFGAFSYDFRFDAYDTWALGIGIAKAFGE